MAELSVANAKLIQYLNEAYGVERRLETALEAHIAMATSHARVLGERDPAPDQGGGLGRDSRLTAQGFNAREAGHQPANASGAETVNEHHVETELMSLNGTGSCLSISTARGQLLTVK